jgi:hypothetical protein
MFSDSMTTEDVVQRYLKNAQNMMLVDSVINRGKSKSRGFESFRDKFTGLQYSQIDRYENDMTYAKIHQASKLDCIFPAIWYMWCL